MAFFRKGIGIWLELSLDRTSEDPPLVSHPVPGDCTRLLVRGDARWPAFRRVPRLFRHDHAVAAVDRGAASSVAAPGQAGGERQENGDRTGRKIGPPRHALLLDAGETENGSDCKAGRPIRSARSSSTQICRAKNCLPLSPAPAWRSKWQALRQSRSSRWTWPWRCRAPSASIAPPSKRRSRTAMPQSSRPIPNWIRSPQPHSAGSVCMPSLPMRQSKRPLTIPFSSRWPRLPSIHTAPTVTKRGPARTTCRMPWKCRRRSRTSSPGANRPIPRASPPQARPDRGTRAPADTGLCAARQA